jgi:hypothetical protein
LEVEERIELKDKSNVSFCDIIIGTAYCIKFTGIFLAIAYAWMWTGQNRIVELDVIHELAVNKILPINYHHDSIFSSFNSNMTIEEKLRVNSNGKFITEEASISKIAKESGEIDIKYVHNKPKTAENLLKSNLVPMVFYETM